ncbi:DUF1446 domain-containing protein [Mycolicibacterium pulveris]|nr:DUF1446 domain-containing protein [Mycolicibacterium pulveris]
MREMLEGGPLDVLTGDYLAELTMWVLARVRTKGSGKGFADTFVEQVTDCRDLIAASGVRIVANAGGLAPEACAEALKPLGFSVAYVDGDDVRGRTAIPERAVTANAYLGGWGIAAALGAGAQIVVTGRVTDAAMVIGSAAWWHGWSAGDFDELAGALVAGHLLECGTQVTGGNYCFFQELSAVMDGRPLGFPIAEIASDGSSVITKHPGTGGAVTVGTVTAQLLYEIQGRHYANPDVTVDLRSIRLADAGPDRVRIDPVRGLAPPPTTKVAVNIVGGYRNSVTLLVPAPDVEAKTGLLRRQLEPALRHIDDVTWRLDRTDQPDPGSAACAVASLTITARDSDATKVGRAFSSAAVELGLATFPGVAFTSPPEGARPYGVYQPVYLPNSEIRHVAHLPDGTVCAVEPPTETADPVCDDEPPPVAAAFDGPTRRVPLGSVIGARSGDKGADANIGVWCRSEEHWRWLRSVLTTERLRKLLPEAAALPVSRTEFPNLWALNFVVHGLLGRGAAENTRQDRQAKTLAEWLRARWADVPVSLLDR